MTAATKPWWRAEAALAAVLATAVIFLLFGGSWLSHEASSGVLGVCFLWLFAMILWGAITVVRHAEALATRLGEPIGTLVLTLAAISIEVVTVTSVMVSSGEDSTLARDTMFAVLMIVLNGLAGLALLLGGLRHHEQEVNVSGARAYLAVLMTLAVLGLVLPAYTLTGGEASFSKPQAVLMAISALGLYGIFLWIQTTRHRDYFTKEKGPSGTRVPFAQRKSEEEPAHGHGPAPYATWVHAALLVGCLLPVFVLCKKLAIILHYGLEKTSAPDELGGCLVALLVLTPEGLGALRAAWANSMQRSVNILLGTALSTIGLTIPAVLCVGLVLGKSIVLGLSPRDTVMLVLTLLVSALTFGSRRTNILFGAVHLVIFVTYLTLIFDQLPE